MLKRLIPYGVLLAEWQLLSLAEVIRKLETDPVNGLSLKEAVRRQEKFGLNRLEEKKDHTALRIFLNQFKSLLIWILVAAALASFFFHNPADAAVILAIVALNALFGFFQEFKAEKAMKALKRMAVSQATVIREGMHEKINAEELVPGDIVLLQAGDRVPADLRLAEALDLMVDEAVLTGESIPSEKTAGLKQGLEKNSLCFMNSIVVSGKAKGIVVSTGMGTEFGKIAGLVMEIKEELTPLQKRLGSASRWIAMGVPLLVLIVFLAGYFFTKMKLVELALVSVALAVSVIPEGLPAVMTITLALGMQAMAKKNALVRKMAAVESLGSCNVICSDKTGTLTKNEMTVQKLFAGFREINVSGEGYSLKGSFSAGGKKIMRLNGDARKLLETGLLCNNARLDHGRAFGDPTEVALLASSGKAGLAEERKGAKLVKELGFDSGRKRMTKIYAFGRKMTAYCKGSPESILGKSSGILVDGRIERLDSFKRKKITEKINEFASNGLRVLGFAVREVKANERLDEKNIEKSLGFVGLQAMIDAPRKESIEAIRQCRKAGIKVVMITGDHKLTAVAVARQLGLMDNDGIALLRWGLQALT
ncbi:HAD-IC family P-type ATPase [archaeon]|nr:HAD-IC family P-type ATPase [archaeon]